MCDNASGQKTLYPDRRCSVGADSLWRDTLLAQGNDAALAMRDWRFRHGLSVQAAAEALGLSRRMLTYYEAGQKPVPRTVLLATKGQETEQRQVA